MSLPLSVFVSLLVPDTLPVYKSSLTMVVLLSLPVSLLLSLSPWSEVMSLLKSVLLSVVVAVRLPVYVFSLTVVVEESMALSVLLSCSD